MYAFPAEDIDRPGQRRGHRRDKHREPTVLEFLDDERGDEGLLDLGQRRLPYGLVRPPRELLSQTAEERIAREAFEKGFLDLLPGGSSRRGAEGRTDEETDQ